MQNILMTVQLIISVLLIVSCINYDTKNNLTTEGKVNESTKNAFISKAIKIFGILFFICALVQLKL